jgi:hypothetical protein
MIGRLRNSEVVESSAGALIPKQDHFKATNNRHISGKRVAVGTEEPEAGTRLASALQRWNAEQQTLEEF